MSFATNHISPFPEFGASVFPSASNQRPCDAALGDNMLSVLWIHCGSNYRGLFHGTHGIDITWTCLAARNNAKTCLLWAKLVTYSGIGDHLNRFPRLYNGSLVERSPCNY